MPKNGTIQDLIEGLIKKARLEDEATKGPIRVFEAQSNKFYKEFTARDLSVVAFTDYTNLYAERVSDEDDVPENNWINAFHFQVEPNKAHGVPFKFPLFEVCSLC